MTVVLRITGFVGLMTLLPGCALLSDSVKTEQFIAEDIVGVWMLSDASAEQLRIEQLAFLSDGRKCSVNLSFDAADGAGELRSKGRWRLSGDAIVTELEYSASAWLLKGDVLRQQIISSSPTQLQLRWDSEEPSQPRPVSDYRRVSGVSVEDLCRLAGPREQEAIQTPPTVEASG